MVPKARTSLILNNVISHLLNICCLSFNDAIAVDITSQTSLGHHYSRQEATTHNGTVKRFGEVSSAANSRLKCCSRGLICEATPLGSLFGIISSCAVSRWWAITTWWEAPSTETENNIGIVKMLGLIHKARYVYCGVPGYWQTYMDGHRPGILSSQRPARMQLARV